MSVRELWYKFLAAMARSGGNAPGLSEEPPAPRDLEPHVNAHSAHGAEHTWKAHGGDRH